jgi:hypothetical protein
MSEYQKDEFHSYCGKQKSDFHCLVQDYGMLKERNVRYRFQYFSIRNISQDDYYSLPRPHPPHLPTLVHLHPIL